MNRKISSLSTKTEIRAQFDGAMNTRSTKPYNLLDEPVANPKYGGITLREAVHKILYQNKSRTRSKIQKPKRGYSFGYNSPKHLDGKGTEFH